MQRRPRGESREGGGLPDGKDEGENRESVNPRRAGSTRLNSAERVMNIHRVQTQSQAPCKAGFEVTGNVIGK